MTPLQIYPQPDKFSRIDAVTKKKKVFEKIGNLTSVNGVGTITANKIVTGRLQVTIDLGSNAAASSIQDYLCGLTFSSKGRGFNVPPPTFNVQVTDNSVANSNLLPQTINVKKKLPPI